MYNLEFEEEGAGKVFRSAEPMVKYIEKLEAKGYFRERLRIHLNYRPCPLCGADDYGVLFRDKNRRELLEIETDTVKCRLCGMIYLNPIPDGEEFLKYYEKIYIDSHTPTEPWKASNLLSLFLHYFSWLVCDDLRRLSQALFLINDHRADVYRKPYATFLDVGCGHGLKLRLLVDKGYEVWAIDPNPEAIKDARERLPKKAHLSVGTLETVKLPEKYFDYIQLDSVFEHLHNPLGCLATLKKHLAEGGKVVLYIPSVSSWMFHLLGKFCAQSWVPFHINLFSRQTIRAMAEKEGYQVVRMYPVSEPWWVILSVRQLMRWRRRSPVTFERGRMTQLAFALLQPTCWLLTKLGNADSLVVILEGKGRG